MWAEPDRSQRQRHGVGILQAIGGCVVGVVGGVQLVIQRRCVQIPHHQHRQRLLRRMA